MHEKMGFSLMRPFDVGLRLRLPACLAERLMPALLLLPLTYDFASFNPGTVEHLPHIR